MAKEMRKMLRFDVFDVIMGDLRNRENKTTRYTNPRIYASPSALHSGVRITSPTLSPLHIAHERSGSPANQFASVKQLGL